eukprot:4381159-Prymnesium_polylepis.1
MWVTLDTSQRLRSPVNTEQPENMHCGRAGRVGVSRRAHGSVGSGAVWRCMRSRARGWTAASAWGGEGCVRGRAGRS